MQRLILAFAAFALSGFAQKFEVASIKPNHANDGRRMIGMRPGGRFTAAGISLKELLAFAYNVRDYQLSGLPSWADSDRYDIDAKPEGPMDGPTPGKMRSDAEMQTQRQKIGAMMADLLEQRFGLKIHRETKEMPVYALVVAKNGPKLVESKPDAPDMVPTPSGRGPAPDAIATGGRGPIRGERMSIRPGEILAQEMPLSFLANQLSSTLGRNVIDKTGLTGHYDIKLTWTPDDTEFARKNGEPAPDSGPSIFTAVQEQLGLKLESSKAPVDLIVVDHVEKPTEN
jgi:uncharacterized protein (TIGR03435 family)